MSLRAAEEGKKCIFKYKERKIDDDAGRISTSGGPHVARGPRV